MTSTNNTHTSAADTTASPAVPVLLSIPDAWGRAAWDSRTLATAAAVGAARDAHGQAIAVVVAEVTRQLFANAATLEFGQDEHYDDSTRVTLWAVRDAAGGVLWCADEHADASAHKASGAPLFELEKDTRDVLVDLLEKMYDTEAFCFDGIKYTGKPALNFCALDLNKTLAAPVPAATEPAADPTPARVWTVLFGRDITLHVSEAAALAYLRENYTAALACAPADDREFLSVLAARFGVVRVDSHAFPVAG